MFRRMTMFTILALATGALAAVGCSKSESSTAGPELTPAPGDAASPSDVPEELASLSDEDRAAVLEQKICPVSDQELGSMGTPIKVHVNDRDVFICCEGCRESLIEDPDTYLAKLDAQP